MRKIIIAGNWKMHKTISEAIELANGLKRQCYNLELLGIEVVLCPPFTAISEVFEVVADSSIQVGGQDLYWEREGAFTGEISNTMLKEAGCKFVIVGHSERRRYFQETDEIVNKKLKSALSFGLTPIVCVGETLEQREKGLTLEVLESQVRSCLVNLVPDEVLKIVIAYEPVWAIGTGRNALPAQAEEAHKYIRELLAKIFNEETAVKLRIQYGGSVTPQNAQELLIQPDVDGALVGGASIKVDAFAEIIKIASEIKKR